LGGERERKKPNNNISGMKRILKVLNSQRNVSFFSVAILHRLYGR
jgi:hypothetical protein